MEKEDREIIIHMSETLDTICAALTRPPKKLARVFEIAATVITLLGILSVLDIIKNWIGG